MKLKNQMAATALSIALASSMVMGLAPAQVLAAPTDSGQEEQQKGYDGTIQNVYTPAEGGTIYYVDSEGGNDGNDGMSASAAFKTLDKVNSITLKAGDSILLKRGSIFDGQHLAPKGRGTEEKHILISAYGEGNMPVINANREYREALLIENMEYVDVTGIEVTNDDVFNQTTDANDPNNHKNDQVRSLGVHVTINENADTFGSLVKEEAKREWRGINIDGLYIHNVDGDENCNDNKLSGGIGVEVIFYDSREIRPYFNGVTLQNNRIESVDRCGIKGIRLSEYSNGTSTGVRKYREGNVRRTDGTNQAALNYVVRNNYLSDIGGDGILMDSCVEGLCENNLLYNHTMRGTGANAGIWSWNTFDCLFRYNEVYGGPAYNQDGCSYDSDFISAGTIFEYNYSHDCVMGFMLLMGTNDTDVVRYNLSQNDGNVWRHIAAASNTPSYIYNNVFLYNGDNWRFINNNSADTAAASITKNWEFYNNIFYNTSKTTPSTWKITDWENAVTKNNMVYEASGQYGDREIPGAIHADPLFVNPGGGKTNDGSGNIWSSLDCYKLQAGSPAIGTGAYVDVRPQTTKNNAGFWDTESDRNAKTDFYGNALYNGAPDIGLEESSLEGGEYPVEKNASYRIMNPETMMYLTMTGGEAVAEEGTDEDQTFTVVGTDSGYKIRIWDNDSQVYRYLAASNGALSLSETEETVWGITDLHNGLYRLSADGRNLICSKDGSLSLGEAADATSEWYLEMEEHSHSYNVGGGEIEGFSADQVYDEAEEQSGSYIDSVEKFTTDAGEDVYKTGVKGDSIGYRIFASDSEYTLRLYFAEPDGTDTNRTMSILVNGNIKEEEYVLTKDCQELVLTGVYPQNGVIDVRIQGAYNSAGTKTDAVLSGISADKLIRKEVESRINAGGSGDDGLAADTEYSDANGAGWYDVDDYQSQAVTAVSSVASDADAGIGTAMKTAREGEAFGYKVKSTPGTCRVKLYFAESATGDHEFDITVNGKKIESAYNIKEAAGGAGRSVGVVYETEAADGVVDILFQGVNGKKAMVNAVIVEAYDKPEGEKAQITAEANSEQSGKEAAKAVDGNAATRWASTGGNDMSGQTITFTLDETHILNGIVLDWTPNARAKDYHIEVSDDGTEYRTVATVTNSEPGLNVHTFDACTAKYVRVVCDQKLNTFAASLTEAEIYVGEAVAGEAAATLTTEAVDDSTTELAVGMGYIYNRYSTAEVKFEYDPAKAAFVEDSTEYLNGDKLDKVSDPSVENGTVTQRFGLKKWDGFREQSTEMMRAQFTSLTSEASEVVVTVSLTNSAGHVTELAPLKVELPGSSAPEEPEKPETAGYYEDYYFDTQTGVTGAVVEDQALHVTVEGTGASQQDVQTAIDADAPSIDSGTFYTRFTVESQGIADGANIGQDQVLFDIKANENSVIRIGFDYLKEGSETGNWFYGKSTANPAWGNFPNGTGIAALEEGTEHTLKLEFTRTAENIYTLHLTVDGQDMGTVENVPYESTPGQYGFAARRTTKAYTVRETYYGTGEEHKITVQAGEHGTVSQTGDVTVFSDVTKVLEVYPEEGYEVDQVLVNGTPADLTDGRYTFANVTEDQEFSVTFKEKLVLNTDKLLEVYNQYKDLQNDSYTEESWTRFTEARDAAAAILADPTAYDQNAIDAAAAELESAKAALEKQPEEPGTEEPEDPDTGEPEEPGTDEPGTGTPQNPDKDQAGGQQPDDGTMAADNDSGKKAVKTGDNAIPAVAAGCAAAALTLAAAAYTVRRRKDA